jgi:hypothetical protein
MKLTELSCQKLDAEQQKADQQILQLKAQKAPEDGPLLAALRVRRSEILGEIARRSRMLEAA